MEKFWKTIKSKLVHENPWYKILEDDVALPDGNECKYFVMDYADFVIVIPLTKDNEVYLVGQYRYPTKEYTWELPSGGIDIEKNETPLAAAKREMAEEVSLQSDNWEKIGEFYTANSYSNQRGHVYVAREVEPTTKEIKPDYNEFLETKKVTLEQLGNMIKAGEITDGPTMACFCKLQLFLDS
ncbi:NUDIX hydrolase [Candidatus Kuenenbacteria bacterium]|nr:NUDIX hydrolase [Candidatus Kuenenbacteria bacterium]